ncbi:MAG: MBOAT family protein [Nitrospirota bacterium]|nr:MBOAT family protein [Nitrospirota bacterium]
MVFSSTVFLFLFLPLVLVLYAMAPRQAKNPVLLAASLVFYAWGEMFFVSVMVLSISANYLCGLLLEQYRDGPGARRALALGVAANLLLLGTFKYANFLTDNLNALRGSMGLTPLHLDPVHLPIGVSFFTFQAISYLIDVYRREEPVRHDPWHVALYISMFPQLIAGPIVRYHHVARQLVERTVFLDDFAYGARRFIVGLGKKVLLANPLGAAADQVFALPGAELTPSLAWFAVVCYTLQIYFDFSGYSDMAIGLGRMFGFSFPENFNYPYISRSIREFWRRWHISLSTWFRDYLYLPLGGNRKGPGRTALNLLTVFFLCGLWHGASWNFVIWGLLHGAFLGLERSPLGRLLGRTWAPVQHLYTLLVVMVAWVFFRIETLSATLTHLAAMVGFAHGTGTQSVGLFLTGEVGFALLAGAVAATPVAPWLARKLGHTGTTPKQPGHAPTITTGNAPLALLWGTDLVLLVMLVLSAAALAAGTYNPFIYFRF